MVPFSSTLQFALQRQPLTLDHTTWREGDPTAQCLQAPSHTHKLQQHHRMYSSVRDGCQQPKGMGLARWIRAKMGSNLSREEIQGAPRLDAGRQDRRSSSWVLQHRTLCLELHRATTHLQLLLHCLQKWVVYIPQGSFISPLMQARPQA